MKGREKLQKSKNYKCGIKECERMEVEIEESSMTEDSEESRVRTGTRKM